MKRKTLIQLHLISSSFSTFILLLFILTGSLYLFGVHGEMNSEKVSVVTLTPQAISKEGFHSEFERILKEHNADYHYDYLRGGKDKVFTRPTTKIHYMLERSPNSNTQATLYKRTPDINSLLMEFHKGHGPKKARVLVGLIGIIFCFTLISGFWLGVTMKAYRKKTLLTSLSGVIVILILFWI